MTEVNQKKKKY